MVSRKVPPAGLRGKPGSSKASSTTGSTLLAERKNEDMAGKLPDDDEDDGNDQGDADDLPDDGERGVSVDIPDSDLEKLSESDNDIGAAIRNWSKSRKARRTAAKDTAVNPQTPAKKITKPPVKKPAGRKMKSNKPKSSPTSNKSSSIAKSVLKAFVQDGMAQEVEKDATPVVPDDVVSSPPVRSPPVRDGDEQGDSADELDGACAPTDVANVSGAGDELHDAPGDVDDDPADKPDVIAVDDPAENPDVIAVDDSRYEPSTNAADEVARVGDGSRRGKKRRMEQRDDDSDDEYGEDDDSAVPHGASSLDSEDKDFKPFHPYLFRQSRSLKQIHDDECKRKAKVASERAREKKIATTRKSSRDVDKNLDDEEHGSPDADSDEDIKRDVKPKLKAERNEDSGDDVKPDVKNAVHKFTPKQAYTYIMLEFVRHVDVAFNPFSQARAASIAVMQLVSNSQQGDILPIESLSEIVRSLIFVRATNDTLAEAWTSEMGKVASKTRRRIMYACVHFARRNVFGDFAQVKGDKKPRIPPWLVGKKPVRKTVEKTKVYAIDMDEVEEAVDRNEVRQDSRDDYDRRAAVARRAYPSRKDTEIYTLDILYANLRKMFTSTRRSSRLDFFNSVGYLFMNWGEHKDCLVSDKPVVMRWVTSSVPSPAELESKGVLPSTIPFARPGDRDRNKQMAGVKNGNIKSVNPAHDDDDVPDEDISDPDKVRSRNRKRYIQFGRHVHYVTLLVEHDVIIRKEKVSSLTPGSGGKVRKGRKRVGSNRRRWRRAINLMDVVRRLLENMCGYLPKYPAFEILRTSARSISLMYQMARTLRAILSTVPNHSILDPSDFNADEESSDEKGVEAPHVDGQGEGADAMDERDANDAPVDVPGDEQGDGTVEDV